MIQYIGKVSSSIPKMMLSITRLEIKSKCLLTKKKNPLEVNSQNLYKMTQNVLILSPIQFYVIFLRRIIYFMIEKVNV